MYQSYGVLHWKWKKSSAAFVLGGVNKQHDNGVYV